MSILTGYDPTIQFFSLSTASDGSLNVNVEARAGHPQRAKERHKTIKIVTTLRDHARMGGYFHSSHNISSIAKTILSGFDKKMGGVRIFFDRIINLFVVTERKRIQNLVDSICQLPIKTTNNTTPPATTPPIPPATTPPVTTVPLPTSVTPVTPPVPTGNDQNPPKDPGFDMIVTPATPAPSPDEASLSTSSLESSVILPSGKKFTPKKPQGNLANLVSIIEELNNSSLGRSGLGEDTDDFKSPETLEAEKQKAVDLAEEERVENLKTIKETNDFLKTRAPGPKRSRPNSPMGKATPPRVNPAGSLSVPVSAPVLPPRKAASVEPTVGSKETPAFQPITEPVVLEKPVGLRNWANTHFSRCGGFKIKSFNDEKWKNGAALCILADLFTTNSDEKVYNKHFPSGATTDQALKDAFAILDKNGIDHPADILTNERSLRNYVKNIHAKLNG